MGRSNKSKRFVKQGADAVSKHAERIPYHLTLEQAEQARAHSSSTGGQM
ncbi:hypothetical protein [Priestia endophytica]|jgi:hypothetical protein|nr:hypothetical protein [Priestia endophytica]MED4073092.1 hypothetical protein [Priestia endophytica]RPK12476.1 hypothetical protein FH5_02681 [Priestia endophytica]